MVRDCDQDAVLYEVDPSGPACHTGETTCFHDAPVALAETAGGRLAFLQELYDLILQRRADMPEGSYTAKLFQEGPARIAQKVGEEGVEVVAAAPGQTRERVVDESADLLYHLLVLWAQMEITPREVLRRLEERR